MTEGQVYGARRNPATPIDRTAQRTRRTITSTTPSTRCSKLVDTFPKSVTDRYFVVRTALDSNLQRYAEHEVESKLRQYGHDYGASQAAAVFADLDGGVRAMIGGRDYGASQFNRATDALRQPGSSFKPYVYATALANGFTPNTIVVDSPVCIGNWCPHNYSGGYSGSMTLIEAITHSVNVIPVKLSIALGNGNPKIGRAMIVQTARNFGIHAPLPDTPSLPIGADEVYVFEHAVAYATFPNLGRAVVPHAALEVRTGTGQVVWRFDRDGPKPKQVISPQVALEMIKMMNSVVENGTGKRAQLDGIKVAGKTGTTNSWRDAWFVGYTGNFVGAVWMGNDDFSPTKRMTGGTLPAVTWHNIMTYAHQGIELRPLPGLPPPTHAPPMTDVVVQRQRPAHPALLTRKGTDALIAVERMLDDASRALAAPVPAASLGPLDSGDRRTNTVVTAADRGTDPRAATRRQRPRPDQIDFGLMLDMRLLFGSCFTLLIAAAIGLGATWLTLTRGVAFGALSIGAWTAWPKSGSVDIDPYARASIARSGELPTGLGDGVAFYAHTDDAGNNFDGRCTFASAA